MPTERGKAQRPRTVRRLLRVAIAALWGAAFLPAALVVGQQPPQEPAGAPGGTGDRVFLWDGFEREPAAAGWSVDSADDPARLSRSVAQRPGGSWSLGVEARCKAKNRVLVRRAARVRLDGLTAILADVNCPDDDLKFSFAYKDSDGGWHEGPPVPLRKGWNRDVRCPLSTLRRRGARGPFDWELPEEARQFYLVIHAGASPEATVHVDNLRFEGQPAEDWDRMPPGDIEVYQPERGVGRYGKFELGVQFGEVYGNLFDADDVLVEGLFTAPDGRTHSVPGFFAGYADSERFGPAWPIFLIKFAPTRLGRWTFAVRVRNCEGETTSGQRWFYVTESPSNGFVRVSPKDPRFFELDEGEFCYPIGQNIAWAQDYEPYFLRQSQTGQNWVRIWLCPWHLQLEKKAGRYDLDAAVRLDHIVERAAAHGLRIQLVLLYHGMVTGESWAKNPYNRSNGGPCYLASEFFTNAEARKLFKRRLDYIAARWGYSSAIFAWELFNEVDFAHYASFEDVVAWHREMSAYLKRVDLNRHLVTTSLSRESSDTRLWSVPGIDFVQAHIYGTEVVQQALETYLTLEHFRKPFFIGEYGRSTSLPAQTGPAEADRDRLGEDLRRALWGTFTLPIAGNVMPWWWDSLIRPHNLERFFEPLSRFAAGVDRRSEDYELIETAILKDGGSEIAVRGLLNNHACYLWLHRPAGGRPPKAPGPVLIPPEKEFALSGMLGGKYLLTVMDTATGRILRRSVLTCELGRLTVSLPRSEGDVAVKIEYQGSPKPSFLVSPELLRLEEKVPARRQ